MTENTPLSGTVTNPAKPGSTPQQQPGSMPDVKGRPTEQPSPDKAGQPDASQPGSLEPKTS